MKKEDLSWQSLRQKDINKLLIPQKKIKTIKDNTAINVSFSESAVAAHPFIIPDIAQMAKDISAILQMADVIGEKNLYKYYVFEHLRAYDAAALIINN